VNVKYVCELADASKKNTMFCEWGATVIAIDKGEMDQNASPIFPQLSFLGTGTTFAQFWTEHSQNPSHKAIAGFLDAFEGLFLSYNTYPYGAPAQYQIWSLEASVWNFGISSSAPDTALTDFGIFLGTQFGNANMGQKYTFQENRAFGFLR